MKLIVGLGNPGGEYDETRHNVGFQVIDELKRQFSHAVFDKKFKGLVTRARIGGEDAILLKPMTYMNLSGESVGPAAGFYKIPPEDIIVVHDELDIEPGRIKLKKGGGHGGHNGLKSLVKHLPNANFTRVRLGIGRPPPRWETANYVLGKFTKQEQPIIEEVIRSATKAVEVILEEGLPSAMKEYNRNPAKAG
ncbi:MAG: aminoacyl-tRNA hydrolase [Myxococcota bacterium]|nr:aminoacyl-tRNA hydrolase [Myxococcota bacterium]